MKYSLIVLLVTFLITACAPKVGSDEWCASMKQKSKSDWTAQETKDFAQYCIFK